MRIMTSYSVQIKHYNRIFADTVRVYREAVDFLIRVCLSEWKMLSSVPGDLSRIMMVEHLTHRTAKNPSPKYGFDTTFYKFPSYLRRAAIAEALGMVSSYQSNLRNWERDPSGRRPTLTSCGYAYPALYRDEMYKRTGEYTARIKIRIRNTWDWLDVTLKKSDVDYIRRRCSGRKECVPVLRKRGKRWFLDFPFDEETKLYDVPVTEQIAAAVDLGINNAACVSVQTSEGTILGRHFLRLPKETDSLNTAVNRIKKAQRLCAKRTPRLWARAKGINDDIAVKTAQFIIDVAVLYSADVIVFEHLDLSGRKRGSKRQRLHLWKARYVQSMVTDKAHRLRMRVSRVNAWNTSRLAYDGSGRVKRGRESDRTDNNYSLCEFTSGKLYNCDLNASYNIGARYFIRELIKSMPATARLRLEAKVPRIRKRSTCTLSDLINLNAELKAIAA